MTRSFRPRPLLAALAFLFVAAPPTFAAPTSARPVVPGFERFFAGDRAVKADRAEGGRLLLGELNCVSCHQPADAAPARKQAPVLDNVAARARVGYLRKFIADPQAVKPGSTMPTLLAGDPNRADKVEALVQFLASTGTLKRERPDRKSIPAGRDLFARVGCVACHGPRDAAGQPEKNPPAYVVPLGDLKAKYSISSLAAFLESPQHARPAGRMPQLLNNKEAREVANYLLQGIKVDLPAGRGGTTYAYYEGAWSNLPDFAKLKPKATGTSPAFDVSVARRANDYAIKFDGVFKAERDGDYRFTVVSDDGSRLLVDGKQVAVIDGIHPPQPGSGAVKLTKGIHKITVQFFQGGGGAELNAFVEGPGLGRQDLAPLVAPNEAALEKKNEPKKEPKKPEDDDAVIFEPQMVDTGRQLFGSLGCANCHQMNANGKPLASTRTAPALAKLKPEGGCLAPNPAKGLPHYSLGGDQRNALAAAIKSPSAPSKAPAALVARTMLTFNCYACHSRDKVGGPEDELNKFFQTVQPEMGDEGRVPPPLDGVGAKLRPDYMRQILDRGAHDRPYMLTRMPGFGNANVGHLVEAFGTLDPEPKAPRADLKETPARVKAAARHMVGAKALGCIKCHTFNGQKAEGIQGIDMTLMPKRVRHDWFVAYLIDPQKFRPGTRMPSAWPEGKSFFPDILGGTAANQIEGIWVYLQDGPAAQLPVGVGNKSPIVLEPEGGAIIYRNFLEGPGMKSSRAIGVGYPEKVSLAFDANEVRLGMIWQGAFIDAARHWTDRGVGFERPLGDNVLPLHPGVPFAVLEKPDAAWPAAPAKQQGYRFKGYRLTPDDRPTFLYSFDKVSVEDFPNAVGGKEPSLKRTLTLTASKDAPEDLYFRAAVGNKIEPLADGWFRIDGWKTKLDSAAAPQVRQSNGKAELLVPVRFKDGKAKIVQEFVW